MPRVGNARFAGSLDAVGIEFSAQGGFASGEEGKRDLRETRPRTGIVGSLRHARLETLGAAADAENFERLLTQFCDDSGAPRGNDHRRGALSKVIDDNLGESCAEVFEREFAALGAALLQLQRRGAEPAVLALNQALFTVGSAYLERYQAVKAEPGQPT